MWKEEDHPRGQPDNAGQFVENGGGKAKGYDSRSDLNNLPVGKVKLKPVGHRDIPYGVTKEDFVREELGIDKGEARKYIESLDAYFDNEYEAIRQYQRGEPTADDNRYDAISSNLERYIEAAPKWGGAETYRGIGLTDEDLKKFSIGSVHDMGGISSWSSEEEISRQFADHSQKDYGLSNAVILHSKTQRKGTGVRHLSPYPGEGGENEVIASKDSRYKVINLEKDNNGRVHIYMEEV